MLSRSFFNVLELSDDDSSGLIPGVEMADQSGDVSCADEERRIIVANMLPLKCWFDAETKKWGFDWDEDALVLQMKEGFEANDEVVYVGSLNAEIDAREQDEVAELLLDKFNCVPTFIPNDIQDKFYHGCCKHYLWPLFHYRLPMTENVGVKFDKNMWQAYISANKIFAQRVAEVLNPDHDYVWIQDYHLLLLPTFLRKKFHKVKLGFFLHSPFPSSEMYRALPVRTEILRALLNCDLLGFHTYDYARHFLSACSRLLGVDSKLMRGYIGLEYYGRTVCIKILPVGIHMGQIESVKALEDTGEKVKELRERFNGKTVMLGVDDMDIFKGISSKFYAMGKLLEEYPHLRGKVVLVQILNPARSQGRDIQQVIDETERVATEINQKFGDLDYVPIVFVNGPVSTRDKVAYYAISDCCVVNALRDGMNLVPYKYTVSRQGSPVIDKAMGLEGQEAIRKSVIIVSEFVGCSPSLSGAIRVNPWNVESVSDAMRSALSMSNMEKQLRHEKHYKYVSSHDVAYWARSFDQDLKRACTGHLNQRCLELGFGLSFKVVAMGPNFRKLSVEDIVSAYRSTNNRLILLDYDGTMMPQGTVDKAPSSEVIKVLEKLCSEPQNVVFIVSGRGKESLSTWFAPCRRLGLSAEHGYFTRWTQDSRWECSMSADYFGWKRIALPVMEHYTEATDGSFIEQKESALVWNHQQADPDFGSCQAKELHDHLESVLANEPVVVKRGQQIVEVKPQGVSKGVAVERLIATIRSNNRLPDFVLCVGDDSSDEDMFASVANCVTEAEVYACTVGRKPSNAKFYLDDTDEVIKMLQRLAQPPESQVSHKRYRSM
ncbi:hypothetical protein ACET3Z_010074 [Daucus carota]